MLARFALPVPVQRERGEDITVAPLHATPGRHTNMAIL